MKRRLTIKDNPNIRKTRVKSFLLDYFKEGCPITFEDSKIQCGSNRGRTINDLYALVKSYFPRATKKQVAYNIIQLIKEYPRFKNNESYLNGIKEAFYIGAIGCEDAGGAAIHNTRYYYFKLEEFDDEDRYEWESWEYKENDIYSFNDILDLANEYEEALLQRKSK